MSRAVCIAHEVRCILAAAPELTCAQILARAELACTTTQIACVLATDLARGLVTRAGAPYHYRYTLTPEGLRAAQNPNYLRSGKHRRRSGQRHVNIAALTRTAQGDARG